MMNFYPGYIYVLFEACVEAGFSEELALDLVKTLFSSSIPSDLLEGK